MKTLLIIDAGLGQARAYMAKTLLGAAAPKAHLELIDNPNDAELAIVLGTVKTFTWAILTVLSPIRSCSWEKRKTTLSPTLRQRR